MSAHFTARLPLRNCRLSPYKATLYEIKSWNGCRLVIFSPSCNIYSMFALVHSDAKKISTQQSWLWKHLLIASIHSLGLWIWALVSFQEVPPSTLAVSEPAKRRAPYPYPWLWSSSIGCPGCALECSPYLQARPVSLAHSRMPRETGEQTAASAIGMTWCFLRCLG